MVTKCGPFGIATEVFNWLLKMFHGFHRPGSISITGIMGDKDIGPPCNGHQLSTATTGTTGSQNPSKWHFTEVSNNGAGNSGEIQTRKLMKLGIANHESSDIMRYTLW